MRVHHYVSSVRSSLDSLVSQLGRESIQLMAVTKYCTLEQMACLRDAGVTLFGENKVQDAEKKISFFDDLSLSWHMIGHLQRNKVRKAVSLFDCIQSVDSISVASKINDVSQELGKIMPIYLQVNMGKESGKYGFLPSDLLMALEQIKPLSNVEVRGIMIVVPNSNDKALLTSCFEQSYQLYLKAQQVLGTIEVLSMGMSQDYLLAVQEGATMVRLGRILYDSDFDR